MVLIKKKKRGFTLVELIAVIAIIAVLAAAFVPKFSGFIDEARKVAVLDDAKKVVLAYESIKLKSTSAFTGDPSIEDIITKANGLLTTLDITKINPKTPLSDCQKILDTENYTFTLDSDKKFSSVSKINP